MIVKRAYENFFRRVKLGEKPGYPRFKKKGVKDRFRCPQGVRIEGNRVFLPKTGWVKYRKTRDIQGVIIESLDISQLLQSNTRNLAMSISDAGWRIFLNCLREVQKRRWIRIGLENRNVQI